MRVRLHLLATALIVAVPAPAFAQADTAAEDENAPIVVTAQRRAEAQVDVPISVTAIGEQQLATANVQELADIVKVTPALRFDMASGFFQPTIRGIGTAVTTSGGGGNVGIYVDGFYSPNPLAADFDLLSTRSIQVLKGPQGTLFGRNTTGGAILVQSAEPEPGSTHGEALVSYGRFNELKAQAFTNLSLSDRAALTLEGQYKQGDGWKRDISNGNRRAGDYKNWSFRAGFMGQLTDAIEIVLRYKHADVDDPTPVLDTNSWTDPKFGLGAPFGGVPGTFTTRPNEIATGAVPEFFRSNSDVVQGTIRFDLGFAELQSLSQYRNEQVNSSVDLDHSGMNIFQLGLPNRNNTWSQEFLLTSKPGPKLQWVAGLFYFQNTDKYLTFIDNGGSLPAQRIRLGGSSTTVKSYAAFLDATLEVTPQLFLTAGARYANDKVTDAYWNPRFTGTENKVPSISDSRVTPRFVVRYKPTDQTSIYASYTKGYKAAIIDVGGSCQNAPAFSCNAVKPEDINAFEAGFKFDGGRTSFETAAFYYDYKNLQVSLYRAGTAEIVNAAKSEIYGLEAQGRFQLTPAIQINAGAAWVHARYKRFTNAPVYVPCRTLDAATQASCAANGISYPVIGQNLTNVPMQRTPEFTGFVGARYAADLAGGEFALSGNLFYSSKLFFGPAGNQFLQGGYETVALRAEWTDPSDTFTLAVFGDNVTNSRYYTGAQYTNFGIGANWSKPATYGVEARVRF